MTRRAHILLGLTLGATLSLSPGLASADVPAKDPSKEAGAKPNENEARAHFAAGVNLVRDPARPRYEEAYAEFKKAYALAASPKILGNIGLCAMKLERDAEAIDAYARYLSDVPDLPAEERAQVERDLSTLKATLANVTVETSPPGATIVDTRTPSQGDPITNTHGPINGRTVLGLRRGHHTLKARFEDGREVTWDADVNGGESHVFALPAPPAAFSVEPKPSVVLVKESPNARPIPTTVWIAGGATVALGVGSLVTGLIALDTNSRFDAKNDGADPSAAEDLRSSGKTLNVVSDVLLVGALVGAGVTTYLYLTRPSVPSRAGASPRDGWSPVVRF